MKTTYKIVKSTHKITQVHEYWDDLHIFTYIVYKDYQGGNIEEFLIENNVIRSTNFDVLNEFHRRTMILVF